MFQNLMNYLQAPGGGRLRLIIFKEKYHKARREMEIIESILIADDGRVFPIVNGIPRMLPTSLVDNIRFCEKYSDELKEYNISFSSQDIERFKKANDQVKSRFEFQWRTWGRAKRIYGMDQNEYKVHIYEHRLQKPIPDEFFRGKVYFEGGCGHGMVSQIMSPLCKEYIGLDIGVGIDIARWRSRKLPNVNLIQGDILDLPIKEKSMDFVFSTGVIHHTPDTLQAFRNLARLPKIGGHLMVWVYPKGGFWWEYTNRFARFFTTRMPPKLLYLASYAMIPILYVVPAYAENRPGKNSAKELTQSIYDWLSPAIQTHHTPQELARWFRKAGYGNIEQMVVKTGAIAQRLRCVDSALNS